MSVHSAPVSTGGLVPGVLRCVIIDDDPLSTQILETHIGHTPNLALVASLTDGLQLLDYLRTQPPVDVLFLDVEMPLLNGMEVLNTLRPFPQHMAVVLTTSRSDFAVEAFALRVADYLVKPVGYSRFYQAVTQVREWLVGKQSPALPTAAPVAAEAPAARHVENSLFVKKAGRLVRVAYDDILYLEAVEKLTIVITSQQQYSSSQGITELAARLPEPQFTRVHRSYIVNRRQIESVEDATITVQGGRTVPVGRTYLKGFLDGLDVV